MSKNYALKADDRDVTGKGAARSLRREGKTPAVIYGDKKEPVKIALDSNDINVEYYKGHLFTTLCDLEVGNDKHLVLARDVQLHPVTDVVEHVDFLRVTAKTKIVVDIPVHFINEDKSPGMQEKGTLNVVRYTIEMRCAATHIPEQIEVDLEGKDHGDSVNVSDATLPEGTRPVSDDRDFTIATIMAPRKIEDLEALDEPVEETDMGEGDEDTAEGEESAEGGEGEEAKEGGEE